MKSGVDEFDVNSGRHGKGTQDPLTFANDVAGNDDPGICVVSHNASEVLEASWDDCSGGAKSTTLQVV